MCPDLAKPETLDHNMRGHTMPSIKWGAGGTEEWAAEGFPVSPPGSITWTPKVCEIMALMAVIMGLGPFCYILLGFR